MEWIEVKTPKPIGTAYRYTDTLYSSGDDEYGWNTYIRVHLNKYPIIKKTDKGIWLDNFGSKRFVLLAARKKFACLTIEEALASYKARKNRQIKILVTQLKHANEALRQASTINPEQAR